MPGPLFTFAAYLGAVMGPAPNGWLGAAICLVAIFLPSFLLVIGVLPFWQMLRGRPSRRRRCTGVNAAVVGLLLAALYNPVWTTAIWQAARFRAGARGIPAAHGVEDAAVARRAFVRGSRSAHRVAPFKAPTSSNSKNVIAGLVPATSLNKAPPCHINRGGRDKPGYDPLNRKIAATASGPSPDGAANPAAARAAPCARRWDRRYC